MKKTNSRLSMALKTFLLVTVVCSNSSLGLEPALAKDKQDKRRARQSDSDSNPDSSVQASGSDILGLDNGTLNLVNEGKWLEAASALEAQTAGSKTAGKKDAWLAFSYLYLNNCIKLTALNDSLGAVPSQPPLTAAVPGTSAAVAVSTSSQDCKALVDQANIASANIQKAINELNATLGDKQTRIDLQAVLQKIQTSTENIAKSMAVVNKLAADKGLRPDIKEIVAKANAALSKLNGVVSQPNFGSNLTQTLGTVRPAATEVDEVAQQIGAISDTAIVTTTTSTTTSTNRYALVISAFDKICEGRRDDALALIQQLATLPGADQDPICVFAKAAIASKRGMPAEAAAYSQRVVALAPNFAWGYRTLGFLQQYSMKQPAQAELSYQQALRIQPELSAVRKTLIQMKVARNDFDGAIELARAAIALHPQDASTHYQLADEIFIKQWRFIEASQQLDEAIRYDAGNAKYYRAQAGVKRLQGDMAGALKAQQMAVQLGVDKAFELVELASLEQLSGDNAKAIEYLEQAIALQPDNSSAHEKLISLLESGQRYDALIAEYTRLLKDKPKDAKLHLRLAKALANAGKVEDAEKQFVEAANLDPTDAEPHRQMGLLKILLRQFGAAAKEYTRALNINPSSVPDLVSLGYCYAENDDYMQAEAAYVTALALQQLLVQSTDISPDRLDIMRSLAVLLMHETRYSDAASQFESIIAMRRPGADTTLDRFMLARAQAMRDLTSDSATNLQKAFEQLDEQNRAEQSMWMVDIFLRMKRPELAHALVEKHAADKADTDADCSWLEAVGRYEFESGNAEVAKAVLSKVVDSKGASNALKSRALATMADGAYYAGDMAAAEKSVRSAIDIYPKNFWAQIIAGRVALKNKDAKLANDFAKKALETNPYDARALLVMGQAQAQLGDSKSAIATLKKAIAAYPGMPQPHKALAELLNKQSPAESKKEADLAASLEAKEK